MIKDTNKYRGKVELTFKRNNKIIKSSTHNTGLSDMALLFAKAITGNISPIDDLPRLLDIGYVVPSANTRTSANTSADYFNNGVWMSILNSPVNVGGRQYKYDSDLTNWVGILTSTVYYSDINGAVFDDVLQHVSEGDYELKARLCSYNKSTRKYFAEIDLTADDLTQIRDKTSAIFTWYTELLYNEDGSSSFTGVDVSAYNTEEK